MISQISINISFKQASMKQHRLPQLEAVRDLMIASGITALDNAPVTLWAVEFEDLSTIPKLLSHKLKEHYKMMAATQVYTILGSTGLLGDPVGS